MHYITQLRPLKDKGQYILKIYCQVTYQMTNLSTTTWWMQNYYAIAYRYTWASPVNFVDLLMIPCLDHLLS